jgi:hypothetical protein
MVFPGCVDEEIAKVMPVFQNERANVVFVTNQGFAVP